MNDQNDLLEMYQRIATGDPWYGKNLTHALSRLNRENALKRIGDSYNCAELIAHITRWRKHVIHLIETARPDIVSAEENFPTIEELSESDWKELVDQFDQSFAELKTAIARFNHRLEDLAPESKYTWRQLILGVMHHDIYHCGQINLLVKFG